MAAIVEFLSTKFAAVRAGASMRRGSAAMGRGDGVAAVAAYAQAVDAKAAVLKTTRHATVARAMAQLAAAHRLNGDQGLASQVQLHAHESSRDALTIVSACAPTLSLPSHFTESSAPSHVQVLTECVDIMQETLPASDPEIPIMMNNLAVMLRNTSQVSSIG
jgi:hypothetical protein